jgi:signal transduction histidine kinase/streptogramin lyase
VLGVCEDSKENLWIGTWGDGVTVFNKAENTYKHFKNDPNNTASLSSNNAWVIFQDRDKNIWIGTYGGGLNLYNPDNDSFIRYQLDEKNPASISNNKIHSIFEDRQGNLLVSTDGGGINLFDKTKKTFTHLIHDDKKNSISNNSVGEIYEDRKGILWISTMVGLNSLDRKTNTFTTYTTKDGLPNNTIFGILEDERNNLWISTNNGISRFNPATKTFKNFGVSDGLQSKEFKEMAYCRSRDGAMYFGGNNGFNKFFPYSIKENSFEPPLVITDFQIFYKEISIADSNSLSSPLKNSITETKEITLSYKSSVISFEFASLNYTIPEKKQYAYILEGFDNKWNEIGIRHRATYTNLNPGKYVFKVKGLNNDGSWSNAVTSFELTITPPFWLTWWFKTLTILSIVGCFLGFYWRRIRTITKQKAALEEQVKERTDEVVRQKEELVKNMEELQIAQEQMSKNVKERHDAVLEKAVAQGKFEIASDVMHDIGNAVVGFGSYLTRIRRLQNEDGPDNLRNLALFFEKQKDVLSASMGDIKADAVVKMLSSMAQTQKNSQEDINKSISEQLNIITNIQEILNIQRQYITGHESQERKQINMRTIINDSLSMLFASLDKMAIAVSVNIPTELPIMKGDRTKLMQALLNILRNSIEAVDINSTERIITVNAHANTDQLILQIKDNGKGFDESTANQLFKRGFTTKSSGAGLGLYNCRTIIESHEGTIDITSEGQGKGTLSTIGFKIRTVESTAA